MDAYFGTEMRKENWRTPAFQSPASGENNRHLGRTGPHPASRDRQLRTASGRVCRGQSYESGSVPENDRREYFSVKLNVSSRHRKASGKCCKTSGQCRERLRFGRDLRAVRANGDPPRGRARQDASKRLHRQQERLQSQRLAAKY